MKKRDISIADFTQFSNLMKIDELEKRIDFAKINSDTASEQEKVLYKEYQDSLKALNVNNLFKEESKVESRALDAISENTDQKDLIRISKAMSIIDKMLRVKLVPEEYTYFLDNKKDFNPDVWADFLNRKSSELNLGLDIPSNSYVISDNMPKIEKFFGTAFERDKVFVKKAEDVMAKDNVKIAALVTGGFHTPALTGLLSEAGYSYVVISPRVTMPTDDKLYRKSLEVEWLPEK
jgi:hypothetical protein